MVKYKVNKGDGINFSLKEKIIKHLIENKDKKESIRQISGALLVDYKNTFNAVNELQPDIVSKDKLGNTNLIEIKLAPNQEIYSVEYKRTNEFLNKNKKFRLIYEDIKDINYPFFIVLIFGSFAKKTSTSKSDLDLCIISDNKIKTKELTSKLKLLPLSIEVYEFTTEEFESMLDKKQENLAHEIIKNNVIIYGIENYYNLISKWMKK